MDEQTWKRGMARAPRGSTRLQIPMHSYKYSKWETIIHRSVSAGINKNMSARASLKHCDRLERKEIRKACFFASPIPKGCSSGFSGKVDKCESLMDLLVAALPYTTKSIGMSTPREIIDRGVEERLRPFDAWSRSHMLCAQKLG
jgi:hypothetical protein